MVGGAAYYAGKKGQQNRDADEDRDARLDDLEYQQSQAAAPPPKADSNAVIEQIQKLAQLKEQGILTDAEFEVQKAKLLQTL